MNSEAFVTLAGLTGRPYLNGQRAHVQGHQGDRIVVMLHNGEVRMRQRIFPSLRHLCEEEIEKLLEMNFILDFLCAAANMSVSVCADNIFLVTLDCSDHCSQRRQSDSSRPTDLANTGESDFPRLYIPMPRSIRSLATYAHLFCILMSRWTRGPSHRTRLLTRTV